VADHALESGQDLSQYRARHIGMVFQLRNLLPALTALENVEVPMFELRVGRREPRERARRLLELVGALSDAGIAPVAQFCGPKGRHKMPAN
jgi:putative ABC transport system ATP-binding protein